MKDKKKSLDYKLTFNESSMLPVKNNEYVATKKRVQTKHNPEKKLEDLRVLQTRSRAARFSKHFSVDNCIVNRIPTSCGQNNKQKSKLYFDAICCLQAPEKHTINAKTSLKKNSKN